MSCQLFERRATGFSGATAWGGALLAGSLLLLAVSRAPAQYDTPPPMPSQETPEVLTSGPVNEAFAAPVNLEPQNGVIAPMAPPEPVSEVPSADKPAGDNYVWVPGYWAWDNQRNNYIWVSACWRQAPPGKAWVPGYWAHVTSGYEWVPGFWGDSGAQDLDYLPTPPTPVDLDPPSEAPSADVSWVPGCWYWNQTSYVQRRGYWLNQQPGWCWTPSHYVWTPRGYIFVRGHWDYPFERRGVLFAPVCFSSSAYSRPISYCPTITLNLGCVVANLFIRPSYSHYYSGDYYDSSCQRFGIYPRFNGESRHNWYDSTYVYDRWHHRNDRDDWRRNQQTTFAQLQVNVNLRPPRTWNEQQIRDRAPSPQRQNVAMAQPLSTYVSRNNDRMPFERISSQTQQNIAQQANSVHTYRNDRTRWEGVAPTGVRPSAPVTPDRTRPSVAVAGPTGPDRTRPVVTQPSTPRPYTPAPDRPRTITPAVPSPSPAFPGGGYRQPYVPAPDVTRHDAERVRVPSSPVFARPSAVAPPPAPLQTVRPAAPPAAPPPAAAPPARTPSAPPASAPRDSGASGGSGGRDHGRDRQR